MAGRLVLLRLRHVAGDRTRPRTRSKDLLRPARPRGRRCARCGDLVKLVGASEVQHSSGADDAGAQDCKRGPAVTRSMCLMVEDE